MKNSLSIGKIIYGIFYGLVVAAAYLFLKLTTQDGGIASFGGLCFGMFFLHLLVWPKLTVSGLLKPEMLFRGALYGSTQMLIFTAQSRGQSSSALVAATMGSICGVVLGRLILKERIQGYALVAVGFCSIAVFSNPLLVLNSHFGVLGGLTQGLGFVIARSLMLKQQSIRQSISTQFFIAGCITLCVLAFTHRLPSITTISGRNMLILLAFGFVIQYGFFYLYKVLDAQRASLLTLSRLPSSIALEHFVVGLPINGSQLFATANIVIGNIFLLFDASRSASRRDS